MLWRCIAHSVGEATQKVPRPVADNCAKAIARRPRTKAAYASTPLLISLKLLLLIGLKKNSFNFYGLSTAMLHAELKEEVYIGPLRSCTLAAVGSGNQARLCMV